MHLWDEEPEKQETRFWQRRFYDFNVWSVRKKNEKMNYMHFNPVKRGLVKDPQDWPWSSHCFYAGKGANSCSPNPERSYRPKQQDRKNPHPSQNRRRAAAPAGSLRA
jgi:hypothetical protein